MGLPSEAANGGAEVTPIEEDVQSPTRPTRDSARPDTKRRNMALENVSHFLASQHCTAGC